MKVKKGKLIGFMSMFILISLLFFGCSTDSVNNNGNTTSKSKGDTIKLKAGGISAPEATSSKAGVKFSELVKEKTNGAVEVEFYPAEQLGTGAEQIDNMLSGTQDIMVVTFDWLEALEKNYNLLSMPYVFEDMDHFKKFLDSPINEEMEESLLENHNIRVLANNLYRSPRVFQATKPVETPEEIKGMKIRVPDIPVFIEHAKQLEAVPVPIAWGETYLAFQQGLADGHDPTMETIYSSKFHEVAPYIMELNHSFSSAYITIEDDAFQQLNEEQQQAMIEAAQEAGLYHDQLVQEEVDNVRNVMLDEGAIFSTPDRKPFEEKVLPMAERLEKEGLWDEGLLEKVLDLR